MKSLFSWSSTPERLIPIVITALVGTVAVAIIIARPDATVTAAIVVGSATVLASSLSLMLGRYFEKEREVELEVRARKLPEYEKFVDFWLDLLFAQSKDETAVNPDVVKHEVVKWSGRLMLWGSDDVVSAWTRFRRRSLSIGDAATPSERISLMFEFEEVLFALRRESGYPDSDLSQGDLLRLFINDIDAYIPSRPVV